MKSTLILLLATLCCSASSHAQDVITYSSLNQTVQLGQFDGVVGITDLKRYGNFGLGSGDSIGSELVMINDTAYSFAADRAGIVMPPQTKLPFAAVKRFNADQIFDLGSGLGLEQLQLLLDSLINTNLFSAIRISGIFDSISYKCYLPQVKPYKPIDQAATKQFEGVNEQGIIVGFFTPLSAKAINSPNYHFHYINQSRSSGGHVTGLRTRLVRIEVDYADELHILLPPPTLLKNIDLNKKPPAD